MIVKAKADIDAFDDEEFDFKANIEGALNTSLDTLESGVKWGEYITVSLINAD